MFKTTFKGYVPSLKLKGAEATIVEGKAIHSKGDSIRYTLRGEYEGRKTLPKTVSKADFEGIYGFDAKEAESVIMTGKLEGQKGKVNAFHMVGEKDTTGFTPETIVPVEKEDDLLEAFRENAVAPDGTKIKDLKEADTVGSPSPASVEPPAPSESPFPQEPSNENFSAEEKSMECPHCNEEIWNIDVKATCELCGGTLEEWIDFPSLVVGETEVKEAFGFGKDDEEEPEEEKPKEQEFTVVLQEGDKLELTDIEEEEETEEGSEDENNGEDEENDEKEDEDDESEEENEDETEEEELEAELVKHTLMICPSCDETVPEYDACMACGQQFSSEYEAVSAKVTRPVKEEEEKEEDEPEDEEGMSTLMKVGLGVGALAVGAAILGAEDEGESDYWAGENAEWRAEGHGNVMGYVHRDFRWETDPHPHEHDDLIDEMAVTDEMEREFKDQLEKGEDHLVTSYTTVERDVADGTEYIDVDVVGEFGSEDLTSSEFVPFDQITAEIQEEWDETTIPIAADYEPLNEPTNANFSAETSTKQGWEITHYGGKHDTRIAKKDGLSVYIEKLSKNSIQHKREGANWKVTYGRYFDDGSGGRIIPLAELFPTYNDIFTWLNNPPFTIHNHAENFSAEDTTLQCVMGLVDENGRNAHSGKVIRFEDSCPSCGAVEGDGCVQRIPANFSADSRMEKRLKEEFARNPRCGECGGGTTEETESGVQETYVYQCQNQDCLWNSWPPHKDAETFEASRHHGGDKKKKLMKDNYENKWKKNLNDRFNKKTIADEDLRDYKRHGQAENFSAEGDGLKAFSKKIENEKKKLIKKAKRSGFYENFGDKETRKLADSIPRNLDFSEERKYDDLVREFSMWASEIDLRDLRYQSETAGSPSPSGPSSVPEPAEATGSEPSNENMEAESKNMSWVIGLTAFGVGVAALGYSDKILALFDRFKK